MQNSPQLLPIISKMPFRLEAMDTQRFNLSKTSLGSRVSLVTQATSGHNEVSRSRERVAFLDMPSFTASTASGSSIETDSSPRIEESFINVERAISGLHESSSFLGLEAMDAQRYDVSKSRHRRHLSSVSTDLDSDSASSNNDSLVDPTTSSTGSSASVTLEDTIATADTDVTNKINDDGDEEYPTTCTVIRPTPRSPILQLFSRPSSPVSRPTSPINFGTLNCFGSTSTFEEDVDYIQAQRAKELAGMADVRVFVTENKEIYREELWRGAVQALLYGNNGEENQSGPIASRGD